MKSHQINKFTLAAGLIAAFAVLGLAGCSRGPETAEAAPPKPQSTQARTGESSTDSKAQSANEGPKVTTGLDQLAAENCARLKGMSVGVLTTDSARAADGRSLVNVLLDSGRVRLLAIFDLGMNGTPPSADPRSGAFIYDLQGGRVRPTADMLRGLDVVVIDLPEAGVRFHPTGASLAVMMEECARRGVMILVLDRPNPLSGIYTNGPLPHPKLLKSPLSYYPVPLAHGMTLGELARLFNDYFAIQGNLEIITMKGWQRQWRYPKTGLPWRAPAPGVDSFEKCCLYDALGIVEGTNVSVGLGTGRDWSALGAPWVDGAQLAAALNQAALQGIEVQPATFTPRAAPPGEKAHWAYAGEICHGVSLRVTDPENFDPVVFGLYAAATLESLYPDQFAEQRLVPVMGRANETLALQKQESPDKIIASWQQGLLSYNSFRIDYLLY